MNLDKFIYSAEDIKGLVFHRGGILKYSPDQARGADGRWTAGDAGLQTAMVTAMRSAGGFTFEPHTKATPESGYAVGGYGVGDAIFSADKFSPDDVSHFLAANAAVLHGNYVGGWLDDGQVHLDVTKVFPANAREEAIAAAKANNQISIADMAALKAGRMDQAFIETGGTGHIGKAMRKTFFLFDGNAKADTIYAAIKGATVEKGSEDEARNARGEWTSDGQGGGKNGTLRISRDEVARLYRSAKVNPFGPEAEDLAQSVMDDASMTFERKSMMFDECLLGAALFNDLIDKYSPDQPRDGHGRWSGGAGSESSTSATGKKLKAWLHSPAAKAAVLTAVLGIAETAGMEEITHAVSADSSLRSDCAFSDHAIQPTCLGR